MAKLEGDYVYLAVTIGVLNFGRYYDGWPMVTIGDNLDVHVTIGTYRTGILWDRQLMRINESIVSYNNMGGLDVNILPNPQCSELTLGHSRSLICHLGGCASHSFFTGIESKASHGGTPATANMHGGYIAGKRRQSTMVNAWSPRFHLSVYNRNVRRGRGA
jgi:hypothetical protein